ncbi:MAG: BrnT family toxin [Desulfomonile tiedjei]|uniref:BrnT family toxin n=1 Tax=Desulfomonile tiedjei TaxID=2358 RepID=A0A9D6V8V1_9BACT|nr:BrnT family toxin [Desulfomonile tiedjei]
MRITDIVWKDRFVEKLLIKHGVSVKEAEETLYCKPLIRKIAKGQVHGENVYSAMAHINNGRYLIVFFILKKNGTILPISARDMDPSERKYYEKHR